MTESHGLNTVASDFQVGRNIQLIELLLERRHLLALLLLVQLLLALVVVIIGSVTIEARRLKSGPRHRPHIVETHFVGRVV